MARRYFISVFLSDIAALGAAFALSAWMVFGVENAPSIPAGSSLVPFMGMMTVGATIGSWVTRQALGNSVPRPSYGRAMSIVLFSVAFTAVALVLSRVYWSRPMFAYSVAFWLVFALIHRVFRRRRPWTERMIVITHEKQLVEDLVDSPHAEIVTAWQPGENPTMMIDSPEVSVVVDLRSVMSDAMAQFVSSANIAGFVVRSLATVYEEHTGRLPMVHLAEGWELTQPVHRSSYAPIKRILDFTAAVVFSPIWILLSLGVAAVIRLDSPGAVMYRQERVGRRGNTFMLYKFRTMVHDAEMDGPKFASLDDPRITRVGRFLRKSRLDELPQLWNVIKGDLSIVGPRPERPIFVNKFRSEIPFYDSRHLIRPGLTGWAQVNYRYADDTAETVEKLTYDLYYVKNSSVWLDMRILGMSIWTVLTGSGAR